MSEYSNIPDYTIGAINNWVNFGLEPGGFLMAVLCNDLKKACEHADHNNQKALFDIVKYLYNETPFNCWGSKEVVEKWYIFHREREIFEREQKEREK